MDDMLVELSTVLRKQHTARRLLENVAGILGPHFGADIVVGYELIPETGGVPRLPPTCIGKLSRPDQAGHELSSVNHVGTLGRLIRLWQPRYVGNTRSWLGADDGYARFLACESVRSFVFLPLGGRARLGVLLLNYRSIKKMSAEEKQALGAYAHLIGLQLQQVGQQAKTTHSRKHRRAAAHTLYDEVQIQLKTQLQALELEMARSLVEIPPGLTDCIARVRTAIFESIRDLVLEASDELPAKLQSISLYKALVTMASALERSWSAAERIEIEVNPLPEQIENLPLELRRLLYTLILEAVSNALRHGGPATYISISLEWENERVGLQVIDHGRGFDRRMAKFSQNGLGFWQRYITQHLGGKFDVHSNAGYGATVIASVPAIPSNLGGRQAGAEADRG